VLWPGAEPSAELGEPRVELPLSFENVCEQLMGTAEFPAAEDYVHALADALEETSTPSGRVKRGDFLVAVQSVLPGATRCPRALGSIFDAFTASEAGDYADADQLVCGFSIFAAVDDAAQSESAVSALRELYGVGQAGGVTAAALTEYLLATATMRNALRTEGDAMRVGKVSFLLLPLHFTRILLTV
jgi:hypothetical protein